MDLKESRGMVGTWESVEDRKGEGIWCNYITTSKMYKIFKMYMNVLTALTNTCPAHQNKPKKCENQWSLTVQRNLPFQKHLS